jgi:hypothetical protein
MERNGTYPRRFPHGFGYGRTVKGNFRRAVAEFAGKGTDESGHPRLKGCREAQISLSVLPQDAGGLGRTGAKNSKERRGKRGNAKFHTINNKLRKVKFHPFILPEKPFRVNEALSNFQY